MPEEEGERKEAPAARPAPTPPAELLQMAELMAEALANSFNENSAITEQLLESLRAKPSGSGSGDVYEIKTVFSRMLSDLSGASKADATTAVGEKDGGGMLSDLSGASKADETTAVGEKEGGGIQKKVRWDEEEENDIAKAINVCGGTGDWNNIYDHLQDSGSKVVVRGKTNITRHWSYIKNEYPVIDGKIIIPATAGRAKQLRKRSEKLMVKRRQKKPPPPLPPPEQPRQLPPEQPLPLQPPPEQPLQPPPKQPLQPPPKQPLQSPPEQPEPLQPLPEHPLPLQPPPEQPLQPPLKQPLQSPPEQPLQPPPKQPLQPPPEHEQPLQVPLPRQQPPQQSSARDAFLQAAALTFVRHEEYMKEMVRNVFEEMWKEKMGGQ